MNNQIFEIKKNKRKVMGTILDIEKKFSVLPNLDLASFDKASTAIVFVDMVNGFTTEGNLKSDRGTSIIPAVKRLDEVTVGFNKVYFVDMHTAASVEFESYAPHCIEGTNEVALAANFDTTGELSVVINKNSVNGFMAPQFAEWLVKNQNITNFVIVGLVTDICVMNFALSLKAYFNEWDVKSNICVPVSCVETYEYENHSAPLMNLFALYQMELNGIKLLNY